MMQVHDDPVGFSKISSFPPSTCDLRNFIHRVMIGMAGGNLIWWLPPTKRRFDFLRHAGNSLGSKGIFTQVFVVLEVGGDLLRAIDDVRYWPR